MDNDENIHTQYSTILDAVLKSNDVKNIAITGDYGVGKSSVWHSYEMKRDRCNFLCTLFPRQFSSKVITVTVGNYTKENFDKNHLERQIIDQIASQIPPQKIPLSKYKIKENNNFLSVLSSASFTILFIELIIFYFFKDQNLLWLSIFLLIIPILAFCPLYNFFKMVELRFKKVKVQGIEAEMSEDSTVFDRDINEIIYMLENSKAEFVVFEDLDRFDDKKFVLSIFTKLRQLNLLINNRLKIKGENRLIKFIYMLKDGLFEKPEDRTKFFDFILPVIPVISCKNVESIFCKHLKQLDQMVFVIVSPYINEMRLAKNIINEFNIYLKIIRPYELGLNFSKLFAIIAIKNIYSGEFDELKRNNVLYRSSLPLIRELRKYGYIDKEYMLYLDRFYDEHLNKDEQNFIRCVENGDDPNFIEDIDISKFTDRLLRSIYFRYFGKELNYKFYNENLIKICIVFRSHWEECIIGIYHHLMER